MYDGGAIRVFRSTLLLHRTTIAHNQAGSSGGGLSLSLDATLTMTHSLVQANRAWLGGGISMGRNSNAVFEDDTFKNNYARTG